MAYNPNELLSEAAALGSGKRVFPTSVQPKTFKQGSGTIDVLTPLGIDSTTGYWVPWTEDSAEITTITANATPATDGTFTLTVDGVTTGAIDHDASTTAIKQAIVAAGICNPEEVTVTETSGGLDAASGYVTITFAGDMAHRNLTVTADFGSLTGNTHVLAEAQAGSSAGVIKGFLWPDEVTLDSDEEVMGQVMLAGKIHFDDIEIPSGSTAAGLRTAIRNGVRALGFTIEGMNGFY